MMTDENKGYPIVLCGDHAAFELEHANTPAEERPDWPWPSFSAMDWAKAFCKVATALGYADARGLPLDEAWVIGWFANALMRGYDQRTREIPSIIESQAAEIARLRETLAPFERVDQSDWDRLLHALGWSGHDRFWRSVFEDYRRASAELAKGE